MGADKYTLTTEEITHVRNLTLAIEKDGRITKDGNDIRGDMGKEKGHRDHLGFAGEIAVARMLGDHEWLPGLGVEPDANGLSEVRAADMGRNHLILHGDDDASRPFVLVTGHWQGPMTAKGWMMGHHVTPLDWVEAGGSCLVCGRGPLTTACYFMCTGLLPMAQHPARLPGA